MTNAAVFQANEVVTIAGFQQDCECSHCGRPLKVGVMIETFPGAFGAQCLAKSFASRLYMGKPYRTGADRIKELGIVVGKGARCMERNSVYPEHIRFTLKTDLQSI